jgi:GntR family transcriptional regulator
LKRSGVSVQDARQSVTATLAAPDVAPGAADVGGPDKGGRGVEYLSLLYRPDFFCWR